MFQTKKINSVVVKPVKTVKMEPTDILGYDIIPNLYGVVYIPSKKESGKSTIVYNMVKKLANKYTIVYIFCSSYDIDPTYAEMMNYLDKKGIQFHVFKSLTDGKIDHLADVMNQMEENIEAEKEEEEAEEEKEPPIVRYHEETKEIKVKVRKPKKVACKHLLLFDDVSPELKNHNVSKLMFKNRWFKSKVIISAHWLNNLQPACRKQVQYYIILGSISEKKLNELYLNADLRIEYDKFYELFKYATEKPFSFLYIDTIKNKYRINFNEEIII